MDPLIKFFSQKEDLILLNSKLPLEERDRIKGVVQNHALGEHAWVMSSGTESSRGSRCKMIALSKSALFAAAQGVCDFFRIQEKDVIFNLLPVFHVSGLLQHTRAFVSRASLVSRPSFSWEALKAADEMRQQQATVVSLVPTQIYDLVQKKIQAPPTLRLVFVGGGSLETTLATSAKDLGWPLILTYGMTETGAMIAYRQCGEPLWLRLPHLHRWQTQSQNRLHFFGPSLLTGQLLIDSNTDSVWSDPKVDGGYLSDDRGEIKQDQMKLWGRDTELVKIKGETVSLLEMNQRWSQYCQVKGLPMTSVILALPDARDGAQLVLVSEQVLPPELLAEFQVGALAFQRIQRLFAPVPLPRTDLGKIKVAELLSHIQSLASASS